MEKQKLFSSIRRLSRRTAAAAAALSFAALGAVGYYSKTLPDKFTVDKSSDFTLSTVLPVRAVSVQKELSANTGLFYGEAGIIPDGCPTSEELMLFGSIPIKEVTKETVERPMLAVSGQAFGIKLVTDGVMIIDMKSSGGSCPAKDCGLEIGDVIETVDGESVYTNERLSELIKASGGEDMELRCRRNEEEFTVTLTPELSEGSYRAGMWVRDSSAGIGIMTFIDPETGSFAGLGHPICDSDTHEALPLSKGTVSGVVINGCTKSIKGEPGQLIGEFDGEGDDGELLLNCDGGVYGTLYDAEDIYGCDYELYPLGFSQEVHEGDAYIISQIDGGEPQEFSVTIEKISSAGSEHDMIISVTDEELISETGGIVQGMSGSPIIQDGRLIGAVTHVFVDDPECGYAIFAEKMYNYSLEAIRTEKNSGAVMSGAAG